MELIRQWEERAPASDMPKRVKELNINVMDFLTGKATSQKQDGTTAPTDGGRRIPLDIASSVLFQVTDFSSLKCLILVNKCFFEAFQTSRTSLMTAIVVNMFGESLDWALVLVGMLSEDALILRKPDGTIKFDFPPPINLVKSEALNNAQLIHHVVNKWVDLYEVRHSWLNAPTKRKRGNGNIDVKRLTSSERERFVRGLILYWICAYCASSRFSAFGYPSWPANKRSNIFGYFSNFELGEIMGIYTLFKNILHHACDEGQQDGGDSTFHHWKGYCLSQGPVWFLRLLDDYASALAGTYGGRNEGFIIYSIIDEGYKRDLDFTSMDERCLTDSCHSSIILWYTAEGMDGRFKRIKPKQAAFEG
ncbi:hypothetical protein M408DRAFT_29825 [Serendipita vermifera MAFF 305830]|uniref:Uncharacterized protein n=1 Tax=Serendipita vermifera MAFF 305830 TaxID=933852 RepID=A0A0C3A934_SERVB|nr:hypothetical protein M408DRAFT_29825 [Serendipita vermifera MAFF 305830]